MFVYKIMGGHKVLLNILKIRGIKILGIDIQQQFVMIINIYFIGLILGVGFRYVDSNMNTE